MLQSATAVVSGPTSPPTFTFCLLFIFFTLDVFVVVVFVVVCPQWLLTALLLFCASGVCDL